MENPAKSARGEDACASSSPCVVVNASLGERELSIAPPEEPFDDSLGDTTPRPVHVRGDGMPGRAVAVLVIASALLGAALSPTVTSLCALTSSRQEAHR